MPADRKYWICETVSVQGRLLGLREQSWVDGRKSYRISERRVGNAAKCTARMGKGQLIGSRNVGRE